MARNRGAGIPEKIMDAAVNARVVKESIFGIKGKQAEQGKYHQKKKQYADKFFSHGVPKGKPDK